LARSDSGRLELHQETANFAPHALKTIEAIAPLAHAKQIHIHCGLPEMITVYADIEKLKQVMYILLDNAIKYTPERGEVRAQFSIKGERQPMLCLCVEDTGQGIHPDDYDRIFDRFYRADKSRTRQSGGYGLGLAIAKWIVEAHHGTIIVNSKQGEGSRFTVLIPTTT
jgi:signal transduction histidine kinase